jgi:hypothetical protein
MTDSQITLSSPEAEAPSMVGPGQEGLLEEFIAEQEQAQQEEAGPDLLLGKFKSADDLAKAYQELEKKLGQPREADPESPLLSPPQPYTREQSVNDYGEFLSDVFESAEVNPYEIAQKWEQGEDLSSYVERLEAAGIPRPVVEQYLAQPAGDSEPAAELSADDTAQIKAMVGGDEGFQQLSQWAVENLDAEQLVDYNTVVNSGNKAAIRWALKAMQAMASGSASTRAAATPTSEPRLIGGSMPAEGAKFESQQQVLDAMTKRNDKGQKLYDVDDAYRQKVRDLLARSDVF